MVKRVAGDEAVTVRRVLYHFDKLYDRFNVGYHGPAFSYASMPDQYTLAELQRNELGPGHTP